jgi:hypothetical protein
MPWYIHTLRQMYDQHCWAQLKGPLYAHAVALPYASNFLERVAAAWWVLTGRAHAMQWPEPGDVEDALGLPLLDRSASRRCP